jgi:septin family protein
MSSKVVCGKDITRFYYGREAQWAQVQIGQGKENNDFSLLKKYIFIYICNIE